MHKDIYASGFLYHLSTQQILLQQINKPDGAYLSFFSGKGRKGEDAADIFRRVIHEMLEIDIARDCIHQIYDMPRDHGNNHFIQYAEVVDIALSPALQSRGSVGWFDLKKLSKINLAEEIRQDIVVGQRVINAVQRSKETPIEQQHTDWNRLQS